MTTQLRALPEEAIANMIEITDDAIDAMKLAADVYAMTAYRAERVAATVTGQTAPRPPKPQSKYLRMLTTELRNKLIEMAHQFDADEVRRLRRIGPSLLVTMDREPIVVDEIVQLLCMAPNDAVAWIREHLDQLEARFAS